MVDQHSFSPVDVEKDIDPPMTTLHLAKVKLRKKVNFEEKKFKKSNIIICVNLIILIDFNAIIFSMSEL